MSATIYVLLWNGNEMWVRVTLKVGVGTWLLVALVFFLCVVEFQMRHGSYHPYIHTTNPLFQMQFDCVSNAIKYYFGIGNLLHYLKPVIFHLYWSVAYLMVLVSIRSRAYIVLIISTIFALHFIVFFYHSLAFRCCGFCCFWGKLLLVFSTNVHISGSTIYTRT